MKINPTVSKQFSRWLAGLGSSAIQGGAHTVKFCGGLYFVDKFSPGTMPNLNIKALGILFTIGAVKSLVAYLDENPIDGAAALAFQSQPTQPTQPTVTQ